MKPLGSDASDNGAINAKDLATARRAFGSTPSDRWDERAGICGDSVADIWRFAPATNSFGKSEPPTRL